MSISNIHIKEVKVDNYKSLRKSKIDFKNGLNIIIGKNGAGKSNILQFIYFFATRNYFSQRHILRPINTSFSVSIEYLEDDNPTLLSLHLERIKKIDGVLFPESNYSYEITINKKVGTKKIIVNKKILLGDKNSKKANMLNEDFKEIEVLRYFRRTYIEFQQPNDVFWISKPSKFIFDKENDVNFEDSDYSFGLFVDIEWEIESNFFDGISKKNKNNPTSLKNLLIKHLNNFIKEKNINDTLNRYTPIKEIRINPNINIYSNGELTIVENLSIDFLIEKDWMPWSYLSDGTKRLFFLVTQVARSTNGLVLVEEPELGIHPHQLFKILEFLKDQSLTRQIIISTHSPIVLDVLNQDELDRISIAKINKGTQFYKLNKTQITKAQKYMNDVGELSYYWLHSDLEK